MLHEEGVDGVAEALFAERDACGEFFGEGVSVGCAVVSCYCCLRCIQNVRAREGGGGYEGGETNSLVGGEGTVTAGGGGGVATLGWSAVKRVRWSMNSCSLTGSEFIVGRYERGLGCFFCSLGWGVRGLGVDKGGKWQVESE